MLISCAPQVRPDIGSTSHPSEDEEAPVLIDQADWSWATRQGERRNFEQTKSALKAAMEEQGISGLSLVMKIGEKWSQNPSRYILDLGVENPETGKPIDGLTVFQDNRLGQSVIAYIVLRLFTDNQFDINRPLYKYLPKPLPDYPFYRDLKGDSRYEQLTARLILSHQSGLANLRRAHPEHKLAFEASPGKGFGYSEEGYRLLQFVLEKKFGRSLNELAKSLVFDPLGMSQTSFIREPRFEGHIVTTPDAESEMKSSGSDMVGTFITNASDFTKFMWTVRLENPHLSPEAFMSYIIYPAVSIRSPSILEMPRPGDRPDIPKSLSWCLGWGRYHIPRVMLGICSFIGQRNQGIESYAMVYESQKSIAITIFAASTAAHSFTPSVLKEVLGDIESPLRWLGF